MLFAAAATSWFSIRENSDDGGAGGVRTMSQLATPYLAVSRSSNLARLKIERNK